MSCPHSTPSPLRHEPSGLIQLGRGIACVLAIALLAVGAGCSDHKAPLGPPSETPCQFDVRGVVRELYPDDSRVLIRHDAISNYMAAMTMNFQVRQREILTNLSSGDVIQFRLNVTESESWIDKIARLGSTNVSPAVAGVDKRTNIANSAPVAPENVVESLSAYWFTNEFGKAVNFREFQGQAIAFTFFFTRCPLPEYCPRLTKNFAAATAQLKAMTNAPTNWHFFSISFDAGFDNPGILRAYARQYGYDSNRWTFLMASSNTIAEVTSRAGFAFKWADGTYDHNFLTVILNAAGRFQSAWPIGGDTSGMIVGEILKACSTNTPQPVLPDATQSPGGQKSQ